MEPQLPEKSDVFNAASATFDDLRGWLAAEAQANASHATIEQRVCLQIHELGRRLLQAHMDLRALQEQQMGPPVAVSAGAKPRSLARDLDTVLGTVRVRRVAWQVKGGVTVIPLDRALDLPSARYSYGVERFVAEQAEMVSYDRAGESLLSMRIDVPKRQREQIVVRMAQDFSAFYAERPRPANDVAGPDMLLVMSADSAGVRVVHSSLREDTRKEAERAAAAFLVEGSVRGDPMAPRVGHTHDRRMAVVTMNWDQARQPRCADDILEQFEPKAARVRPEVKLPRPQNRRVRGTLEHSQDTAIREMFEEAQRRDPKHQRVWVVLLDGSASQREQVLAEARRREVNVELVLDVMHVLHYLWAAGKALHGGTNAAANEWVTGSVKRLLTRPVAFVVSGLRQIASQKTTSEGAQKALRKCATYLENNTVALDYAHALAEGYPIATGNIEGACRYLIRDRMDITGARWTTAGAEAMIQICALHKSGDWREYCGFHFHREHLRSYPELKMVA